MKRMVIAAPHSGSGKTTVTLGIMAALKRRGLLVAPFKVGPDFIDPGYHRLATGAASVNLDGWLCGAGFLQDTFLHHAGGADVAVIEGVMGLFDGIDGVSEAGSTAQVAKLLAAPVLLVVDARSQARSAAAVVRGFASFDPWLNLGGVVFNNVASANHEQVLREAMAAALPAVAVIGCLPRDLKLAIPSRHLGLLTAEDNPLSDEFLAHAADVMEQHLDLDRLLALGALQMKNRISESKSRRVPSPGGGGRGRGNRRCRGLRKSPGGKCGDIDCGAFPHPLPPSRKGMGDSADDCRSTPVTPDGRDDLLPINGRLSLSRPLPFQGRDRVGMGFPSHGPAASPRIALARDAAFCFVYQDNLRLLKEQGAELCFFSPLTDETLPEEISGIYLPGGYPELFAGRLAENHRLKEEIRRVVHAGMPVYAECGGFIYLTEGVKSEEAFHHFVGLFPVQTRMLPRRKALGYREVELLGDSVIGDKGSRARGHEFHYSEMEEMPDHVDRLYRVSRKGVALGVEGFRYKNCFASYVHLHFGSSPSIAETFVRHCLTFKKGSVT